MVINWNINLLYEARSGRRSYMRDYTLTSFYTSLLLFPSLLLLVPAFNFAKSRFSSRQPLFWLFVPSLTDVIVRNTNNSSLSLHYASLACTGVLVFLLLLVEAPPRDSPGQLCWLLPLVEERLALARDESHDLSVSANMFDAMSRVNSEL